MKEESNDSWTRSLGFFIEGRVLICVKLNVQFLLLNVIFEISYTDVVILESPVSTPLSNQQAFVNIQLLYLVVNISH